MLISNEKVSINKKQPISNINNGCFIAVFTLKSRDGFVSYRVSHVKI